ncbi:PcfJ domain-containing protein [Flavobacterium bizetiae]|uniref:PcfJ domain-containing protein n=1 Tax=Flavobacterium bizetiae TaxID=2704140 RepID=UPI0037570939
MRLEFTKENLSICVMESLNDFLEQGDMLHHCVFEYYKKRNSLILSARFENKPVETIEVAIPSLEVLQCRGDKNKVSPHHKQILKLLHQNLYLIKKRLRNKKEERAENWFWAFLWNSAAQTLEGDIVSGFRLNSETKFGKERRFAEKKSPINAGRKTCFIALLFSLAFSFPAEVPLLIFKL